MYPLLDLHLHSSLFGKVLHFTLQELDCKYMFVMFCNVGSFIQHPYTYLNRPSPQSFILGKISKGDKGSIALREGHLRTNSIVWVQSGRRGYKKLLFRPSVGHKSYTEDVSQPTLCISPPKGQAAWRDATYMLPSHTNQLITQAKSTPH